MKHVTMRTLITEAVIGAAVCAGGYFLLVQPMENEIARTRDDIALATPKQLTERSASLDTAHAQRLVQSTAGLRTEIAARSSTALTEAGMFAALVGLADAHSVQVDEVLPMTLAPAPAPSVAAPLMPGSPPADAPPTAPAAHRGYSISAVGSYSALAAFIRALQNDLGLTCVKSVRMRPDTTPGSTKVLCTIETEHWAISLPGQQTTAAHPDSTDSPAKEIGR